MKPSIDLRTQTFGDPPILSRMPPQISASGLQVLGTSLVDEDSSQGHQNRRSSGLIPESDASKSDKHRSNQNLFSNNSQGFSFTSSIFMGL